MRVAALALALGCALAPLVAAAPDERSPIDFAVGNEVFTRREVMRNVGAIEVVGSATPREKVYQAVRLRLARDAVLFQQAQHLGIAVSADQVRARLRDEIRRSPDPTAWLEGMRQLHADDLAQYLELRRRSMTIDEYQRRLLLGPEVDRAQPMQILFVEVRPSDVVAAGEALRVERAHLQDGWLWEARLEGSGAAERAAAVARAWREPGAAGPLDPDAPVAAIQRALATAGVGTDGLTLDRVRLTQEDWATGVYSPQRARPLCDALAALKPGAVSEPLAFAGAHYVFRLARTVARVAPRFPAVEDDARGELIRVGRNDRIRAALASALRTMHVWPADLAAALRKDAGIDDHNP